MKSKILLFAFISLSWQLFAMNNAHPAIQLQHLAVIAFLQQNNLVNQPRAQEIKPLKPVHQRKQKITYNNSSFNSKNKFAKNYR
jgi:hypothetical protein